MSRQILPEAVSDVRYALRSLLHSPGFTAAAVLALVLGIGANTAVFSVVEALLTVPLPIRDPDRAALVQSENVALGVTQGAVSVDDFLDFQEQATSFTKLVAGSPAAFDLEGTDEPQRLQAFRVTPGFFDVAGFPMTMGRVFGERDAAPGAPGTVVLSSRFWQQQLGSDPGVLGRELLLDGRAHTVVGVAHRDFFFPNRETALWVPLSLRRGVEPRDARALFVFGELADGRDGASSTEELGAIATRLTEQHPATNADWTVIVQSVRENFVGGTAFAMILLYGSVTFVLLIACANVANLLLARASTRTKEMALRSSLGAGRWRVVRQLLTESVVLAVVGGVVGLGVAAWAIARMKMWIAADANIGFLADQIELNGLVLLHALLISVLAGVVFGLVPALQLSKSDLQGSLREGGRAGQGRKGRRLRTGLVVAEVSLALGLLGTAGALIRAFDHLYSMHPGFEQQGLLTFQLTPSEKRHATDRDVLAFYEDVRREISASAGVMSTTTASRLPLSVLPGNLTSRATFEGADQNPLHESQPNIIEVVVADSYFSTLGIPVEDGRGFDPSDRVDSQPVAIVSQETVRRFWPDGQALGRRLKLGPSDSELGWRTVVGVVSDVHSNAHSLRNPSPLMPHVFVPHSQRAERAMSILVRTPGAPTLVASAARQAVRAVDPLTPVDRLLSMDEVVAQFDAQNHFFLRVLVGLSLAALLLAGVGIYGVISYGVQQRAQEIGIRVALGARPGQVVGLVLRQGAWVTLGGLVLGTLVALGLVRLIGSQLEGIGASQAGGPLTFLAVAVVLLVVAQLASYVPVRRALGVDPVETLRSE